MAGLRGNQAYLTYAKQTGKGVEPTKWTDKSFFSGGNIAPTHGTDTLSETDNTRNAGDDFVTQTAVEGSPEIYVRDASIHHPLEYVLGAAVHSGTTNFEHKITPSAALPYVTFGRGLGATLFEQFNDCKVSELTISAGTAQPLTAAMTVMGRTAVRLPAEWTAELAPPTASVLTPYNFNDATCTLGGSATALISSFECTIANSVQLQQTDDAIPIDVVEGTLTVTLGFDLIFENLLEYNKFNYGSESGTTQSPNIFTTSANFLFGHGTNNSVNFAFPKIAYQEFPVEPDPGGEPITVSIRAKSQRSTEGFITAIVKNQIAT